MSVLPQGSLRQPHIQQTVGKVPLPERRRAREEASSPPCPVYSQPFRFRNLANSSRKRIVPNTRAAAPTRCRNSIVPHLLWRAAPEGGPATGLTHRLAHILTHGLRDRRGLRYNNPVAPARPAPGSEPDPMMPPADPRAMVRRLAEERARRGLSQADVARRMGVSAPYIAKLERGTSDPRLSTIMRYASIVLGAVAVVALLNELARLLSSGTSTGPGPRPPAAPLR